MRIKLLALLFAVVVVLPSRTGAAAYVAFEQITVANAAAGIGFTTSLINATGSHPEASSAICRLETAQIRWRADATAPTSSVGQLMEVGDILTLTGHDFLVNFLGIRTGGSSGVLDCHYSNP